VGGQRGQAVVVPEADLVVGDGVVLVHHRHDTQLEQARQGLAGVEILLAVHEVKGRQQHLTAHQPVCRQQVVVDAHEPALSHRRDGLQRGQVGRTGSRLMHTPHPQRRSPGGDGPRAHHDDAMAGRTKVGDLGAQLADRGPFDLAARVGHRRRPDLGHHDHGCVPAAGRVPVNDPART
jgi:hypothetical protein